MRIITDTSSDITLDEAKQLGIDVVKVAIIFEDGEAKQGTFEDFETFYKRLENAKALPTTSQPTPEEYIRLLEKSQENDEETLIITLSSGLSGTYNAVKLVKETMDKPELIEVFDSKHAIITQRLLVEKAVELRDQGKTMAEIVEALTIYRDKLHVCGALDTLLYLKKGGRIPASLATIGSLLKVKPLIEIRDGVLGNLGTTRGMKAAKKQLWAELDQADVDLELGLCIGYTGGPKELESFQGFIEETKARYHCDDIKIYPIGGVIGTHLGPGAIVFAYVSR